MDPFSSLPLECLQQILQNLVYTNDVAALTALLQVNKYLATVTLPFLYTAPFRDAFHARPLPGGKTTNHAVSNRMMACTLLSRVLASAQGTHVDAPAARLLSIVFGINKATINYSDNADNNNDNNKSVRNREMNKVSSLDYLAHIRQLDRRNLFPGLYDPYDTLSSDLMSFILGTDFFTLAQLDLLPPTYKDAFPDQGELCQLSLSRVINRTVYWTIAFPILEQLQVIILPISDIGRYLDNVGRLGSLRRVIVSMDKVFEYGQWDAVDSEDLDRVQVWEALAVCKQEAMDKLVRFFREHTRMFSGCLQEVEYLPGDIGDLFFQECPEKVKLQVTGLLPPLLRPSVLNMGNWHQFFAHPEEVDLSCVESVESAPHGKVFDLIRGRREFLRRCRALRELYMASLGEGTFRWAVKEKQELEQLQGGIYNFYHPTSKQGTGATITDQATSRPLYLQHGLVPLADVMISDVSSTSDELDDIVFAFSNTLKSLRVCLRTEEESTISYFGHNGTVDLPVLTRLTISTWNRLKIHRYLLAHCPNLVLLEIFDSNASRYQCQEIVPCAPAQLSKLETITLLGWSSLTFHPDTLYSTERLDSLTISVPYRSFSIYYYIPPVEELDRSYGILQDDGDLGTEATAGASAEAIDTPEAAIVRPEWKWDWHLPHLTKLELSGEYAFRFKFRMLQGCPSLLILNLNMLTASATHLVVLAVADFFMPQQDNSHCSSTPPGTMAMPPLKREYIVAPALEMLTMRGSWSINDAVMTQFLSRTIFPRLEHVTANAWIGFSWVGLTNALRARATSAAPSSSPSTTLRQTRVGRDTLKTIEFEREDPTPDERRDAGIIDRDCVNLLQSLRRDECLAVGLRLQHLYNVRRDLDADR
ncbi:MAG: hypothetical protein JOS17DRAFT_769149 [Linnemannia elongata]|nr:MAG: hypothetical protein JOS17DRAFT_769149 [Linnemannia elongata]